jgi:serine/threonine protein kinase
MAVKILALDTDASPDPASLARFKEEVDLQRRLSLHPFIVRFLGACYHVPRPLATGGASSGSGSGATLAIVMELCRCGTLFKCLEYARRVAALPPSVRSGAAPPPTPDAARLRASPGWRLHASWTTRLALGQHVAAALAWMHSQRVVHRDLTSYNVLITDRFEAKVSDFNLARALRGGAGVLPASGALNSPEWAAPERLAGREYGPAADVYSLGVILHELVTLQVPWADRGGVSGVGGGASASGAAPPPSPASGPNGGPNAGGMVDTAFFVISSVPRGARLAFPTVVDPPLPELADVASLAAACWREDPATRPAAADVCSALEGVISRVRERQRAERGVGGGGGR